MLHQSNDVNGFTEKLKSVICVSPREVCSECKWHPHLGSQWLADLEMYLNQGLPTGIFLLSSKYVFGH